MTLSKSQLKLNSDYQLQRHHKYSFLRQIQNSNYLFLKQRKDSLSNQIALIIRRRIIEYQQMEVNQLELFNITLMKQGQKSLEYIYSSQNEAQPIEKQLPFYSLFRFSDKTDYVLMILGSICAIGAGCTGPLLIYLLTSFNPSFTSHDPDFQRSNGVRAVLGFIYLGIGGLFCGWGMTAFWYITGQRQASKCRKDYYESLLKQDIQFYDCSQQSQLNSKFSVDTLNFQEAIGQKFALIFQVIGQFSCTLVISFTQGWLFTLVLIAVVPLLIFAMYFNLTTFQGRVKSFQQAYSKAGGKAQQAITLIKTVKQFCAEEFNVDFFMKYVKDTSDKKFHMLLKIGLSFAFLNGLTFAVYSLGFWFGSNCVIGSSHCPTNISGGYYTTQNVEVIFFNFIMACNALSTFSPAIKKISLGRQASKRIFAVIDRVRKVNQNKDGLRLDNFVGKVELRNVTFAYPKDSKKKILKNLSISFDLKNSALVGQSGCGKSTIAQLLMRFYDPEGGQILIDGHNIKGLDLSWLRSIMGYVGQQPVLFAATIRENLLFANPQATETDMKQALRQAEVYEFIFQQLSDKIDTFVGAGGSQVSGGQKQRIAIARALIKKPKILILDEATSALDRTNQKLIQKTLNKISERLTTITIAHRIQTIVSSNKIFVLNNGTVQQSGTFSELQYFKNGKHAQEESPIKPIQQMGQQNHTIIKFQLNESNVIINLKEMQAKKDDQQGKMTGKQLKSKEQIIQKYNKNVTFRILSYCRGQKTKLIIGMLLSIMIGATFPIFSIFIGKIISSMLTLQANRSDQQSIDNLNLSSLSFLIIGVFAFILHFVQNLFGYLAGDQIVANLREQTFRKILKMPMKWFDRKENSTGSLCHCLSQSCEMISQLVTTSIFIFIQVLSNIITGFTLCFVYDWKLAFAAVSMFPIIVICGVIRTHFKQNITKKTDEAYKNIGGVLSESLPNIRTVYALNMQQILMKKYTDSLKQPHEQLVKVGAFSGFMSGLGSVGVNIISGLLLYIAIIIFIDTGANLQNIVTSFFVYFFTGVTVANNLIFLPDIASAKIAAINLFEIIDSEDESQMQQKEKSKMMTEGFKPNIMFDRVSFKYESRNHYTLNGLSLQIKEGEKIAFVGTSGCGKSTIMSLLLRFYEPDAGSILINGINIIDFDIGYLRSQFGVVGQEPAVFNASFRDNIRFNTVTASEEDIRAATIKANALQFIEGEQRIGQQGKAQRQSSEDHGFDRMVGLKGSNISGGQKQRLAIARAILKNPNTILLDEATSALDPQNEKIVQQSLDGLMEGKTTITVAHRIQTIENSDIINVMDNGKVVEHGSYRQLIQLKGLFYQLERGVKHK